MTDLVIVVKFRQCRLDVNCATMAEWLRRLTRNQMGFSRVGSNPTCREQFTSFEKTRKTQRRTNSQVLLGYLIAAMAEWLRRLTRIQMGSSRVGSNPTCSDFSVFFDKCVDLYYWWSSRPTILGNGFTIFQRFAGVWD